MQKTTQMQGPTVGSSGSKGKVQSQAFRFLGTAKQYPVSKMHSSGLLYSVKMESTKIIFVLAFVA